MNETIEAALEGALAGAVATVPMSAVMYAAKRAGLMGQYPPVVIADAVLDALGVRRDEETDEVVATIAHLGFGAAAGALYGAARRHADLPIPAWCEGIGFGLLVYAVSYNGWIPAVRILPEPEHDRPGRQPSMAVAHVIYGAVLGALTRDRPTDREAGDHRTPTRTPTPRARSNREPFPARRPA